MSKIVSEAAAPETGNHPAVDKLRQELGTIEMNVLTQYTLADAIREGSTVTGQKFGGWVEGERACALGAGFIAATARGYLSA